MGIIQQKRPDAPRPQVQETDYGAQFVKAATETPVEHDVVTLEQQQEDAQPAPPSFEESQGEMQQQAAPVEEQAVKVRKPAAPARKKAAGRPRKASK